MLSDRLWSGSQQNWATNVTFMSRVHGSSSTPPGKKLYRTSDCNKEPTTVCGHKPVSLAVRTGPSKLSKYCRFDEAVLNDEVTKQEVQKDLTEWVLIT